MGDQKIAISVAEGRMRRRPRLWEGDDDQRRGRRRSIREIERDGDEVTIEASTDELRVLVGGLNEALNGAHAIPADEWEPLVGQPPPAAAAVMQSLLAILES